MKAELSIDEISKLLKAYYQKYEFRNVTIGYSYDDNNFKITREIRTGYISTKTPIIITDITSKLNAMFKQINMDITSIVKVDNNYIINASPISNNLKR